MSLVALGATAATLERCRRRPTPPAVLAAHTIIYGGLYLLFVGAVLHAQARSPGGFGLLPAVDLAASLWPMAIALRLVSGPLCGVRPSE